MALDKEHKYVNEITQQEHDDTANVELKKVGGFGWDADNLEWKRLNTDNSGNIAVTTKDGGKVGVDIVDNTVGLATNDTLNTTNTLITETNSQLSVIENSVALEGTLANVNAVQTDGTQKTQVVDSNGDSATVTDGGLNVNIEFLSSNLSAFGTLETAELTPVLHLDFVYGINTQTGVTSVANSATVDTNASRLRVQSGTNSAGSGIFYSKKPIKYRAGMGVVARFTPIFTTGVADSIQIMGMSTPSGNNGYFFGFNGTAFGILHRNNGNSTWVNQADWNGDKVDGSAGTSFNWDKTKGSPVMIKYPYLGYGDILFFVQNPTSSAWVLVHTIRYSNANTATQLSNPSLNFYAQSINSGATTNQIMYCGSVGVFISGERNFISSPRWSASSTKSTITTETNLLTLKNATTFNTVTNRSSIRVTGISIASSASAGNAIIYIKSNATLGGTPSYTPINGSTADNGVTITNGNSATSFDTAGTTITGGITLASFVLDNPNSQIVDLTEYDIYVSPTETLTISAFSTNSATMGATVNFSEDI